ncbi:hypothetical protein KY289_038082 [Solanum tuberosum]|nr:hypothetical protein KY289_038082 [Solanum tuberosum]
MVEDNIDDNEVEQWGEFPVVLLQQKSMEYAIISKRSSRARFSYGIIFLITNLIAWFVRDYGERVLPLLHYSKACGNGGSECSHTMGVLRVSLGCFSFFLVMFLTTCFTSKLYDVRNVWHSGWWILKFLMLIIFTVIPFFVPSDYIQLYGEFARVGAGVFLILQLISVIEFITWWNNYWMPDERKKQSCSLGLFMSTVCYIASICGIFVMYVLYASKTSCILNIFFISWTAILLVVMMAVSLHSKVNRGLLSSGIMASYVVFLCWSAIRSEPATQKCSSQQQNNAHGGWTTVIGFLIAICAIVMATFSTGIDSQTFQFCKDKVQSEDDVPYKYGFFHLVFSLGAMYFAMLFISWNLDGLPRKWSIDVGWASTWVKIVNEWFAATIYCNIYSGQIPFATPLGFQPPKDGVAIPNANGAMPTFNINGVPLGTGLAGTIFAGGNNNNNNGQNVNTQLGPDGLGLGFGTITVIDDFLTSSPELGTQNLGKAQGVYVASSADGSTQMMAFTAMFEGGEYGDSLNFFGVFRIGSTMSRISVTGGTGKFKNACGFAEIRSLIPAGQHVADGAETLLRIVVHLTY